MFQPGDLVVCVKVSPPKNPTWRGELPVVGNYYTWRETKLFRIDLKEGYVEEIVNPKTSKGIEYSFPCDFFKKVDAIDAQSLVATILQEEPAFS